MKKAAKVDDVLKIAGDLIGEGKYGEAINYLQKIIDEDNKNMVAVRLKEHIERILGYSNRDYFGATNLDMDPWLE
ncbi:MAG: hypothetical protein JXB00_03220 [Bacteroidales bacterium]|nr:hypothetical protein [Bacteroidales bacterium]